MTVPCRLFSPLTDLASTRYELHLTSSYSPATFDYRLCARSLHTPDHHSGRSIMHNLRVASPWIGRSGPSGRSRTTEPFHRHFSPSLSLLHSQCCTDPKVHT